MDFKSVIRKRASIRDYSDKKIKIENIINIIEAGNLAPSPGNLSILKYIIIDEKEKIKKISEACAQEFIKDAPFLIIICSDLKQSKIYEEKAEKYTKQHSGAVIENILLKITDLGLSSCWIGAFSDLLVKRILNIPEDIEVEAIIPVAYSKKNIKQKIKNSLDNIIYFNKWKNKLKKDYPKVN